MNFGDHDFNNDNKKILVIAGILKHKDESDPDSLGHDLKVDYWKRKCTEELEKELEEIIEEYEDWKLDDEEWNPNEIQLQEIEIIKAILKRRKQDDFV